MAKQKLNKTIVERIPPGAQDLVVWDAALEGFGVRVKPTGVKSYIVQYRNRITGASKRLTLGQHGPMLTFEQAKRQAFALLADARRGADPVEERRTARKAPTVAVLASDYLERHAIPKKRPKSEVSAMSLHPLANVFGHLRSPDLLHVTNVRTTVLFCKPAITAR